jgi:hypothetical protein
MRTAALALVSTVVVVAGASRRAEACSPVYPAISDRIVLPRDGASDVPVNARVIVEYEVASDQFDRFWVDPALELRTAAGARVEVSLQTSGSVRWQTFVLTPRESLEPGAVYELWDARWRRASSRRIRAGAGVR